MNCGATGSKGRCVGGVFQECDGWTKLIHGTNTSAEDSGGAAQAIRRAKTARRRTQSVGAGVVGNGSLPRHRRHPCKGVPGIEGRGRACAGGTPESAASGAHRDLSNRRQRAAAATRSADQGDRRARARRLWRRPVSSARLGLPASVEGPATIPVGGGNLARTGF